MFMKYPNDYPITLLSDMSFWAGMFLSLTGSLIVVYLSRCCSPLDSQRVRCREGLAMKSILIGLFGLTLFRERFGFVLRRYDDGTLGLC
jgi:hypothetical protein